MVQSGEKIGSCIFHSDFLHMCILRSVPISCISQRKCGYDGISKNPGIGMARQPPLTQTKKSNHDIAPVMTWMGPGCLYIIPRDNATFYVQCLERKLAIPLSMCVTQSILQAASACLCPVQNHTPL